MVFCPIDFEQENTVPCPTFWNACSGGSHLAVSELREPGQSRFNARYLLTRRRLQSALTHGDVPP
jgi:hypothetical protein